MTLSIAAASRTLSVIGPAVSWLWLIGTMKVRLTRPTVGLKPTMPFSPAGQVIEPSGSVPTVSAARLAAIAAPLPADDPQVLRRSEEHTSELQSLMRILYGVFCLKNKKENKNCITIN